MHKQALALLVCCVAVGLVSASREPLLENEGNFDLFYDANLTVPEIIEKYGYPAEIHHVTTEDGYILELHRIPYGRLCGENPGKRVVLIQHGLLCDSSNWVIQGANRSLAYLLADGCYDVWLGNARGNTYSRNHTTLDPSVDREEFWDFTWHEMGKYDVPANIDYILGKTGAEQIFYIGHSMGTTMFWVSMTERPEYNSKIALMSALAPVAYTENMISPLRFVAPFATDLEWLLHMIGLYEFAPSNDFLDFIGQTYCNETSPTFELCANVLFLLCGFDYEQLDEDLVPALLGHLPAGTSTHNVVHYAQGVTTGQFGQFDYGIEGNMDKYGQETPPVYSWSRVTAPIALYWAENDWLGAKNDTIRIRERLPNIARDFRVPHDNFNHLDFLIAKDVLTLVYQPTIEFMNSW